MSDKNNGYWRSVLSNTYHFFVIILCITNIAFFIYHRNDYTVNFDNSNVILTFIGFLFAIAAINIYSIFNTNIETEKQQLRMEISRYSKQLKMDMKQSRITNSMFRFMVIGHLIATSSQLNSQFLEWIVVAKNELKEFKSTLSSLFENGNFEKFNELYSDIIFLLREERLLLDTFIKRIKEENNTFFSNKRLTKSNKRALSDLDSFYAAIREFESYDFYTQQYENNDNIIMDNEPPVLFRKRLHDWWLATKALIRPNRIRIRVIEKN